MMQTTKSQAGFSAIIVVVLVVLFGLLGTYMVSMSTISSLNTSQSVSAMQAWYAARSGVEWTVHQALAASDGGCTCETTCCAGITGTTLNFNEGGLDGYQATVDVCNAVTYNEASASYCVYDFSVTGSNGSTVQLTSASRTINLSITDRNAP